MRVKCIKDMEVKGIKKNGGKERWKKRKKITTMTKGTKANERILAGLLSLLLDSLALFLSLSYTHTVSLFPLLTFLSFLYTSLVVYARGEYVYFISFLPSS